jgi:hypothetical protein
MRAAILTAAVLALSGCSPLLGLIVRAVESGGGGNVRVGQTLSGSTVGAGDDWTPSCGAPNGGGDQSYEFVPERGGTYRVEVNGQYDCVVALFDDQRQPLACNDDEGSTSRSLIEARMEAGRRYTIVVDGYRGATGSYTMRVDAVTLDAVDVPPPSGDRVLALGVPRQGNTSTATDRITPTCGSAPGSPDETWTFVAPESGTYDFHVDSDYDGVLALYPEGSQTPIDCNDDAGSTRASHLTATLSAGQTYEVVIDGYHGQTGSYTVTVTRAGSGGVQIAGGGVIALNQQVQGDTRSGSDTMQPGCGSQPGSPDQSWTFTAPRTSVYTVHVDSDYDAVLAIYANGSLVECNDDYQTTRMSRLVTTMTAGMTYTILVDGFSSGSGTYRLQITEQGPPVAAGPIALGATVNGDTTSGSDQHTPGCGSAAGSPDQTWTFTVPQDGTYRFHVDSDYDALIALYIQGNPNEMACNDDFTSTRDSRVEATLTAGQVIEVVVDGFSGGRGTYRLQITQITNSGQPLPVPLPQVSAGIENITALEARCTAAAALPPGRTVVVASASNIARTSCGGGGPGGEAVYRVDVQQASMLHVAAQSPSGPVLELREGCSRGHTMVACDDGSNAPASAVLNARLEPGRTYYLIVDTRRPMTNAAVEIDAQISPVP